MGEERSLGDDAHLWTIVDQFGKKISGYTPSCEALGRIRLLQEEEDDENSDFAYERFLVWRDEGS